MPKSARKAAAPLATTTDLGDNAVQQIAGAINGIVADSIVLYYKTKNFHWHMNGKHFRDYHLMLDEQATTIEASIDPLAERVRKLGAPTLHGLGEALKRTSLTESEEDYLTPKQMFDQLIADNQTVIRNMRQAHEVCDDNKDVATASLLETFIDDAERRLWFLFETNQIRERDDA